MFLCMVRSAILGYPRIGAGRELKKALELHWSGGDERELLAEGARIRARHWEAQIAAGLDFIPSGDFSYYDHVLDTAVLLGAVPERYVPRGSRTGLGAYFAMARGGSAPSGELAALEMTKWFDTNYHYIVPELEANQGFRLDSSVPMAQFAEAKALGGNVRPVLLGPVTFLSLAKPARAGLDAFSLLDGILPLYERLLEDFARQGASWVQMDEPVLVTDLGDRGRRAFQAAYSRLAGGRGPKLLLTSYFGELGENLDLALRLPVAGIHLDLARGPRQAEELLKRKPGNTVFSLGLIDGRNIWKADLGKAIDTAARFVEFFGEDRVLVSSSCSLLHCPEDLSLETSLDSELLPWLAFSRQKLDEIVAVARAVSMGRNSVRAAIEASEEAKELRRSSSRVVIARVRERIARLEPGKDRRASPYPVRRKAQTASLGLPLFPTTTIGSFPQTKEVRATRARFKAGSISLEEYEAFLREEIERAIRLQESIGLDVLVHGEFERNDMVEYFGEMLSGFAFTRNGWVQSYGSRCVKPPVIYGDVERPQAMTVRWSAFAQSITDRPVKGMLTGPVTMLQWSFVRDDQSREATCRQMALAIRDEVGDLEKAGIRVIQIDEPAFREGMPLRSGDRADYLRWAVEAFALASSGVADSTQIHTHMCYSEFNDIVSSIAALDADVISIESSRSRMELLSAFREFRYPNAIGPGVYDIHSPRVPSMAEMHELLVMALEVLEAGQLWVNPDCGLKTRLWEETLPSLKAMVEAAKALRRERGGQGEKDSHGAQDER